MTDSIDPITLVETAIVAQLRSVAREYTGLLVESYAGQLDDELFGWIRTLPACWVSFSEATEVRPTGAHSFKVKATFDVLVAQRALQENAGRLNKASAGVDVGVYRLLHDNKLALVNQKLGLAVQPIKPGPIRAVMKSLVNRDAVAVYAQSYSTEWQEVFMDPAVDPDGVLETVGMSYYLKPQHTPPADPADATDLIMTT